jgi:peptide/nickel transport system substrate-binding protein
MKEAGYTPGSDGILAKDGNPLKFTLKVWNFAPYSQVGQMVQQELKALGIDTQIQEGPRSETDTEVLAGKFELAVLRYGAGPDASILFVNFLSSNIGATNRSQANDPKLNDLIAESNKTTDTTKRLDLLAQAQKLVIEQAYVAPLYIPKSFIAVNNRVKGFTMTNNTYLFPTLLDASIESGK